MDAKGYMLDVKGCSVDAKGYMCCFAGQVRGNMYLVGGWDRATFLNDAWLLKPLVPHNIVCTATSPETPRTPQSQWDIGRLIRAEGGQVGPRFLTRILPRFHTRSLTRVLTRFVN